MLEGQERFIKQLEQEEGLSNWDKEFIELNLGDKRLDERMKKIMSYFIENPGKSIPCATKSWGGAKATYRFFDNPKVNSEKILTPHTKSTLERLSGKNLALAIQDTSSTNYNSHKSIEGIGKQGNDNSYGFMIHPTLAVGVEGTPLGFLDIQIWTREEVETEEKNNSNKPIEDKESIKWLNSYRQTCEYEKHLKGKTHFVNVSDREGDMFELLNEHEEGKSDLLVRACQNRNIKEDDDKRLWEYVKSQPEMGEYTIQVPRRENKKAREANLSVRYCEVTLNPPKRLSNLKPKKVYVVYTLENKPPKNEEPISWMLLTTMPVTSFEEALEKIDWYLVRWIIETFFKVLKSGCETEKRQLKKVNNLKTAIVIDSIIAWRILFFTFIGRELPDIPANVIFEDYEWKALHCRIYKTAEVPKEVPTLQAVIFQIAKLGGFLARKQDGFPGPLAIFNGMDVLHQVIPMYLIYNPRCG